MTVPSVMDFVFMQLLSNNVIINIFIHCLEIRLHAHMFSSIFVIIYGFECLAQTKIYSIDYWFLVLWSWNHVRCRFLLAGSSWVLQRKPRRMHRLGRAEGEAKAEAGEESQTGKLSSCLT